MMTQNLNCCGAFELIGINDETWSPQMYIKFYTSQSALSQKPSAGKGFVTFSYAWDVAGSSFRTNGRSKKQGTRRIAAFKKYVEDNELGEVIASETAAFNPNYGKNVRLRAGIFVPDNKAIYKFGLEKKWFKKPVKNNPRWT